MKRSLTTLLTVLGFWSGAIFADDISGQRNILCSVLSSDICLVNEGCTTLAPEELNIPQFIRIDAKTGTLSSTQASGHNRNTIADSMSRDEGQLILQGFEEGRAFSFYIDEASGRATFASASVGLSVTLFAACTPATGE